MHSAVSSANPPLVQIIQRNWSGINRRIAENVEATTNRADITQ